jgi:hypothetical protein
MWTNKIGENKEKTGIERKRRKKNWMEYKKRREERV